MKKLGIKMLAAGLMLASAVSTAESTKNDFETETRVHFVQDCIELNKGKMNIYEATHKCSCVIDELAKVFTEAQYEDADAGFQFQNLPGDRGAIFKDDADVTDGIALFKKTHAEAYKTCRIRR